MGRYDSQIVYNLKVEGVANCTRYYKEYTKMFRELRFENLERKDRSGMRE
jgi:hypothetical protein